MRLFYFSCSQTGITPTFPISDEDILINFSVCMARSVQHRNIQDFLSAIKHYDSSHGYALNIAVFLRFQFFLCGIKRFQGADSKARRPITWHILDLFYRHLNAKYTTDNDSLMVWAAMTLVFFRFSSYWGTYLRFALESWAPQHSTRPSVRA